MESEQRIKEIQKEFIKLGLIDAISMILIGLGLYAKFAKGGEPIFEFLKNDTVVNGMFVFSIPIILWCMFRAFKLASERKNLENEANL